MQGWLTFFKLLLSPHPHSVCREEVSSATQVSWGWMPLQQTAFSQVTEQHCSLMPQKIRMHRRCYEKRGKALLNSLNPWCCLGHIVKSSVLGCLPRETSHHIHVSSGPLSSCLITSSLPFCHCNVLNSESLTQHMIRRECPDLAVYTILHKVD